MISPAIHELMRQVHQLHLESRPDIYRDVDPLTEEYYLTMLSDSTVWLALDGEESFLPGSVCSRSAPSHSNPLLVPLEDGVHGRPLRVHGDYRARASANSASMLACRMAIYDGGQRRGS